MLGTMVLFVAVRPADAARAGDVISVEAGTYDESLSLTTSGEATQPISLVSDGGTVRVRGKVDLDGERRWSSAASSVGSGSSTRCSADCAALLGGAIDRLTATVGREPVGETHDDGMRTPCSRCGGLRTDHLIESRRLVVFDLPEDRLGANGSVAVQVARRDGKARLQIP